MNWDRTNLTVTSDVLPIDYPAHTSLPETYYVAYANIRLFGLAAGDNVYVEDQLSLADPIGSHFNVAFRTRPGHEKAVTPIWMDARLGPPDSTVLPPIRRWRN